MWQQLLAMLGGKNPIESIKELVQTFKLPPEQQLAFEQAAAKTEADLVTALARVDADDRASARAREIQTQDGRNVWWLAVGVTAGFFGVMFYMLNYPVPKEAERVIDVMLGSLGTAWIAVISYYFGSSNGSARKHDLIDKLVRS